MATYAIGDVQGCCDELEALLHELSFDPARDRLWFVGDLVNRGPRSLDVLRLVRRLGDAATTVLGNHDLHLLAIARGAAHLRPADHTLVHVLEAPDRDSLLDWLQSQPVLHHDPTLGVTMVHAGLPPQWDIPLARRCAAELETALRGETQWPAVRANVRQPPGPVGRCARRRGSLAVHHERPHPPAGVRQNRATAAQAQRSAGEDAGGRDPVVPGAGPPVKPERASSAGIGPRSGYHDGDGCSRSTQGASGVAG